MKRLSYIKLYILIIFLITLSFSCNTLKNLRPIDYVYKVVNGQPCFYDSLRALEKGNENKMVCKDIKELEGWLIIAPEKFKEVLTKGIDELILEKATK